MSKLVNRCLLYGINPCVAIRRLAFYSSVINTILHSSSRSILVLQVMSKKNTSNVHLDSRSDWLLLNSLQREIIKIVTVLIKAAKTCFL